MEHLAVDESLDVAGRRVTATELAQARQKLAHAGTGYVPGWDELTADEQQSATMVAAGYLRSLGEILDPASRAQPRMHKPDSGALTHAEACSCEGCWACAGHMAGCTCDVDWDALYEQRSDGA